MLIKLEKENEVAVQGRETVWLVACKLRSNVYVICFPTMNCEDVRQGEAMKIREKHPDRVPVSTWIVCNPPC